MANSFNEFFAYVGEDLANKIPPTDDSLLDFPAMPQIFDLNPVALDDIISYMKDLKPSTSCGVDSIMARLLKAAGVSIYSVLLHICNLSILTCQFPSPWKTGCVTPLHKSGDSISPNNYRPISMIPCLGELLERLIHKQTTAYLFTYNLLSTRQSGFRKSYFTGACLIDFLHHIFRNIDEGCVSRVLFLDL